MVKKLWVKGFFTVVVAWACLRLPRKGFLPVWVLRLWNALMSGAELIQSRIASILGPGTTVMDLNQAGKSNWYFNNNVSSRQKTAYWVVGLHLSWSKSRFERRLDLYLLQYSSAGKFIGNRYLWNLRKKKLSRVLMRMWKNLMLLKSPFPINRWRLSI